MEISSSEAAGAIRMAKYKALSVATRFWRPGEDYLDRTVEAVRGKILDRDFVVISEKALSVATNNILDEGDVVPGTIALLVAKLWMRIFWGYFLGPLCHLNVNLLYHLREYPVRIGARHKQVALHRGGCLQALMFGSEGAIDGSNLPYAYVSLPLENAEETAEALMKELNRRLGRKALVMIVDTDKTYSFRNFHFTPRPKPLRGIHSFGGFISYSIGRLLNLRRSPTPVAVAGCKISIEEALKISTIANRLRGSGSGGTVWNMAERFDVGLADVTWEMLETVKHKPIVIVRETRR